MTVRFALLGAGRIGKVHAKAVELQPRRQTGRRRRRLREGGQGHRQRSMAARCARIDAIAAAKDIDAVVICTPTDTHADLIERFAKAGKAIFCEKPIDLERQARARSA